MDNNKNQNNGQKGSADKSDLLRRAIEQTSTPEEIEKFKELSRLVREHNNRVLQKWKKNDTDDQ